MQANPVIVRIVFTIWKQPRGESRVLDRNISVRAFAAAALILLIGAVLLGWAATLVARDKTTHRAAQVAFLITQFPEDVRDSFEELRLMLSASAREELVSVPADVDPVARGYRPLSEGIFIDAQPDYARGWRYLGGAFRVNGTAQNTVVILSPDLEMVALWPIGEQALRNVVGNPDAITPDYRKLLHGLAVLPDGSFAVAMDNGTSLQRFDTCGGLVWIKPGSFHHSVHYSEGRLWALRDFDYAPVGAGWENSHWGQTGAVAVDAETGEERLALSFDQIRAANPNISLIDLPRMQEDEPWLNPENVEGLYMQDPFHLNDVEPLPADMAAAFPQFAAGDLMISARTLNTVLVVDPETAQIKWYATGQTNRQHDPDWRSDGTISVFDNRMGRGTSQIVALQPAEVMGREVLLDGAEHDFYSFIRGKHSFRPDGTLAVISAQQGRVFEIAPDGRRVFEVYSTDPDDPARNFAITSMAFVPEGDLTMEEFSCNDI